MFRRATFWKLELDLEWKSDRYSDFSKDADLVVEEVSDLGEVAVPLEEVVEHGGLAEEGEVAVEDAPHALLVRRDERRCRGLVVALHVPPHLLVLLHLRVPGKTIALKG